MTNITHMLREILFEGKAKTQTEIQQQLQQMGISSSQPKISRLLHQMGAVKVVDGFGDTQYRLPHEAGLIHELTSTQDRTFFRQCVLNMEENETLVVIHTTPGAADLVARIIDQHKVNLNALGTIAGDDTIFVAPKSIHKIKETKAMINKLFDL